MDELKEGMMLDDCGCCCPLSCKMQVFCRLKIPQKVPSNVEFVEFPSDEAPHLNIILTNNGDIA